MSDASVLSHQYKTASELSQTINRAVITLKKACLDLPGAEALIPEQCDAHRRCLGELLEAFIALLAPDGAQRLDEASAARVPGALVARLQAERRGDLGYFIDDLERVATRLREEPAQLTDADFDLLDQLAAAADAEASSVFRRLMRT
jgi:hypothetical protein